MYNVVLANESTTLIKMQNISTSPEKLPPAPLHHHIPHEPVQRTTNPLSVTVDYVYIFSNFV